MKKTILVLFIIGFLVSVILASAEYTATKSEKVMDGTATQIMEEKTEPTATAASGGGHGVKVVGTEATSTSAIAPTVIAVSSASEGTPDSYRNAYWQCYDSYEENSGEASSCKPSYIWAGYAKEACNNHCSKETGKCGVNTFKIFTPCGDSEAYRKTQPTATAPVPFSLVPVCNINKENIEGWYLNNELVMKDNCLCRAECREIGTENEGYYSTCTNLLILKTKCSANIAPKVVITVKEQPVNAQPTITVATSEGEREIKYFSEEAKAVAIKEAGIFDVTSMQVKREGDRPVYEIQGKKEEKFLYIFPITKEKTVRVDAVTNEIISVDDSSQLFPVKADSKKE